MALPTPQGQNFYKAPFKNLGHLAQDSGWNFAGDFIDPADILGNENIFEGLGSLFGLFDQSKGFKDAIGELNQVPAMYNKYLNKASSYMNPFYKEGIADIAPYQSRLEEMSDPAAYNASLLSSYQTSPFAQNQIDEATKGANAAAAAQGMLGTPAEQEGLSRQISQYVAGDEQQYLNNLMGINDRYMGGLKGMMGQGFNAGNAMGNWDMNTVNALAGNVNNIANLKYGKDTSQSNQLMSTVGSLLPLALAFL